MIAPLDIHEMQHVARTRGGECLSKYYRNSTTKLKFICEHGHEWMAQPSNIIQGYWCPDCGGSQRLTIEAMREMAKARNGKCLSRKYTNAKTPLKWECEFGHVWVTAPKNIRKGHWCPECGGSKKGNIKQMRELAQARNGQCCSKKYINANTKLEWQCDKGHRWRSKPSLITQGSWCPTCHGTHKKTIEDMQTIAKKWGGKCLSETYTNLLTNMKWQCAKGHIWETQAGNIVQGHWCPECRGSKKGTIEQMKEIAKSRGEQCCSRVYKSNAIKLKWKCKEGHTWEAVPKSVKKGSWCGKCASIKNYENLLAKAHKTKKLL